MPGIFKSFKSTVTPFIPGEWRSSFRLLTDALTGAPVGIESPNANGPDGVFVPIDLTAAQIGSPSAAMVADLNATYRLNVAPYTRYQSNGTALVQLAELTDEFNSILQTVPPLNPPQTIGPYSYADIWAPFTVQSANGVIVQGKLTVLTRPA
jgi:hypothetical protein